MMLENRELAQRLNKLNEERFMEVDRDKSLKVMKMVQSRETKRNTNRSYSKSHHYEVERIKSKKKELIHQIQEKLALKQNYQLSCPSQETSTGTLQKRVVRLQKLMEQIKKQRSSVEQPKTVFIRKQNESNASNNYETLHINTNQSTSSEHRLNMELLLKEMQKVREEIKDIHSANQKIMKQTQPRKITAKVNTHEYEQFKIKQQPDLFSRFPPANINQTPIQRPSNVQITSSYKKEMLINDLKKVMSIPPENLQSSMGSESIRISQPQTQQRYNSSQKNLPSEVLYSWKIEETVPGMHPSKVTSSLPVNRTSTSGGIRS